MQTTKSNFINFRIVGEEGPQCSSDRFQKQTGNELTSFLHYPPTLSSINAPLQKYERRQYFKSFQKKL
jgi:hypothetical protein